MGNYLENLLWWVFRDIWGRNVLIFAGFSLAIIIQLIRIIVTARKRGTPVISYKKLMFFNVFLYLIYALIFSVGSSIWDFLQHNYPGNILIFLLQLSIFILLFQLISHYLRKTRRNIGKGLRVDFLYPEDSGW
ncbi:MAG: hypothetical protein DDT22_00591 [candidate division WS2 bacterium]|nr:hypothetical protein [Candidatus Lithacetigena glycinireducens]